LYLSHPLALEKLVLSNIYVPLLVMEHLLQNPVAGIPQPPSHPIALIVTPLIELGNNHASGF
jgi:hypothetical protein